MQKAIDVLKRTFLIFGVIVALTPCGLCNASTQVGMSKMKSCDMGQMSGMKCCHTSKSNPQGPLCKTMNQSSVVPAVHGLDMVNVSVVSHASANVFLLAKAVVFPALSSFSASPPRALFTLRI